MNLRGRAGAGAAALLIYAGITLLSALPQSSLPRGVPDVIPHAGEYFALAFFLLQAFASPRRAGSLAAALLLVAVLAFLDERHQLSVPGRVFSWLDVAYDLAGALAGTAAYHALARGTAAAGGGRLRRCLGRLVLHR